MNEENFIGFVEGKFYQFIKSAENRIVEVFNLSTGVDKQGLVIGTTIKGIFPW